MYELEADRINNNEMFLVKIDTKYCNYLRTFDHKVPYNYKDKQTRPFIGVLFKVNDIMYFAPLFSPKPKHLKLKAKLDLLKIDSGKLGVINFNNMIPVDISNIMVIDLDKNSTIKEKQQYISLLRKQLYWLNRNSDKIYGRSKKLYDKYINNTLDEKTKMRCCNFPLLEEKCAEYNSN